MPETINAPNFESFLEDTYPSKKGRKVLQRSMGALMNTGGTMSLNLGSSSDQPSQDAGGFFAKVIK